MPKFSIEAQIEIEIDGDEEEALEKIDRLLQRFHDQGVVTQGEPEWHYVLLEDCVRNLTTEADTTAQKGTCRHCSRDIVDNPDDGWVDPEATGDDRIWRETCDANENWPDGHEPVDAGLEEDLRIIRKHNDDQSWRQSVPGSTRPGQKPGFW